MCRARTLILLAAAVLLSYSSASGAELVMFRRDGCPWCKMWDRDIGPIYSKTDIGARVPLRMMDIKRDRPEFSLKSPIIYTPTFVLLEKDREVGRIEGYSGDQFFWGRLEDLLQQLPPAASSAAMYLALCQITKTSQTYESISFNQIPQARHRHDDRQCPRG